VPTRRTRDRADVDLSWKIDAYRFDLPFVATGLDVRSSATEAIAVGQRGALAAIDLEALVDATPDGTVLEARVAEIKQAGHRVAGAVTGRRAEELAGPAIAAEIDVLVIHDGVLSAETVSASATTLNLKTFIRALDVPVVVGGCASFAAALHLMRTGAAGVIVGVDQPALGIGSPLATAIGEARGARLQHLDETGVYCHLIARGAIDGGADIAKAIACGADAVMVDAGTLLDPDPASVDDVAEHLREAMAVCGYTDLKSFQKAQVVVR
ncbi:MAG: IMP dehydrogenase, partial [Acidimicrobiales bacterium]